MDLKTKLAFALVLASLLSMAALGYFTHLAAADLFHEDARRLLNALADSRKAEIDAVFDGWRKETQRLVDRIESSPVTRDAIDTRDARALANIDRVLREAKASSENLRRVTLFDAQGETLLGSGTTAGDSAAAGAPGDSALSDLLTEADGSRSVLLYTDLARQGEKIGSVALTFDATPLERFVGATPSIGETGETSLLVPARADPARTPAEGVLPFLVRSMGKHGAGVLREASMARASESIVAALRSEGQAVVDFADHDGREVSAAARPLSAPGWGLVVEVESAEARRRADRLVANMRELGVALAAFATLGGVLLGLRMGRPIYELKERVDRIRHGELGLRLEVKGEDEVAFLAQSLNEFIDQLDRSSDLFRVGALRVLVVASDAGLRQLLGELLRNWRMRPTLVETGANALAALGEAVEAGRPLQLALLDESIADIEAPQLAAQLRVLPSGPVPVIALASKLEGPEAEQLKASGAERLLPKPVVASHLMEAILDEMGVLAEELTATADTYVTRTTPRKILLVDDNRLMQQVMIGFLENWGHEVQVAENGRVALEASRRHEFDLILMDVMMPEMSGLEATAAIRAQERGGTRRTPIIALTAEALTGDRESCLAAGMDDYITKPVDPKALYALIERFPANAATCSPRDGAAAERPRATAGVSDPDGGPVDWQHARSLTNGDDALLDELIEAFPAASDEQLEGMRRAIDQSDAQLLERSAHSLKSAAKIFGASKLAELARAMETLGRERRLEGANTLLEGLETEARRLVAALRSQAGRGSVSA